MTRTKKMILNALEKKMKQLAKIRDELRDLYDELATEVETTDGAIEDLSCCIDKLSETK